MAGRRPGAGSDAAAAPVEPAPEPAPAGLEPVGSAMAAPTDPGTAGRRLRQQYAPDVMCAAYEALLLPGRFGTAAMPSITSSGPERLSV